MATHDSADLGKIREACMTVLAMMSCIDNIFYSGTRATNKLVMAVKERNRYANAYIIHIFVPHFNVELFDCDAIRVYESR